MERFPLFPFVIMMMCLMAINCVEFEDEARNYDDEFFNWQSGLFGTQGIFWPQFQNSDPIFRHNPTFNNRPLADRGIVRPPVARPSVERDREPLGDVELLSESVTNGGQPISGGPSPFPGQFPQIDVSTSFFQNGFGNNFFGLPAPGQFQFGPFRPWWKGENVCVEREEDISDWLPDESGFTSFSINFESCVDKQYKYVCKTIKNHQNRKRTMTVTYQCCHGYSRSRIDGNCEKIDLLSIIETAENFGGKEFIKSAKNNGLTEYLNKNITLFLPTDASFSEFSEQMFESNLVVLPLARSRRAVRDTTGITTKELALGHMVDGWVQIDDIQNEQLLTSLFDNTTIRMNIYPRPPNEENYDYPFRFTANCAKILKINKLATNGIIHVIDKVLQPVTRSLWEIIKQRNDMTILKTILERTNLHEFLEGDKPVTIFAPTDRAFEKLDPTIRRTIKEGNNCAINILKNHILDMTFCSCAVVNDAKTNIYNVLQEKLIFERIGGAEDKKDTELSDLTGVKDILINNKSKIIESDIMGTNGVLHVIDTVLPTDSGVPITSILNSRNLTIFKKLIEAADLEEEFDSYENVSFFAPTDRAFEDSRWKMELEKNPERLKGNRDLKIFLQNHITKPLIKTCDLSEDMLQTVGGNELRVNLYATHPVFSNVMNRATANCARLVHFDDETCGSVLHQVDKILEPPTRNLLEMLESNMDYSKFLRFVREANLTALLTDPKQDLTLFVPKNDVFSEQGEWYESMLSNKQKLEQLVKGHMLQNVLCCAGIVPSDWPFVRTIEDLNGRQLRIDRHRRPTVANTPITKCDVVAKNGVLHEINDVIIVKERRIPQSFW